MSGHPRVIGYLQRALDHKFGAARQFWLQQMELLQYGMATEASAVRLCREGVRSCEQIGDHQQWCGVRAHLSDEEQYYRELKRSIESRHT